VGDYSMNSTNIHNIPRQQGAALITALMFLIIMTMLALTSMGTNTLEERMAANSQEMNRSFQAAEAGLKLMINDATAYDDTSGNITSTTDATFGLNNNISVVYSTAYQQETATSRGSAPSDTGNVFLHFDFTSAATAGGVNTTLHSGAYKEGPGS
jgi:type IV pilus assembly protein PilX